MPNHNFTSENSQTFLTTLFKNPHNAETVYGSLLSKGYKKEDITLLMSDETRQKYFFHQDITNTDVGNKTLEGMGVGGAIGGTVGAIAAALTAVGSSLVIPALGIVVSGAIAASLAGAGAGAATGGLLGALVGAGISDERAQDYEAGIKAGGVVVGVYTKSPEDYKLLNDQWNALSN